MTVDIGDGRQDFITVHEFDDPVHLAQDFASKYGLDMLLQRNLSIMIRENTNEVVRSNLHLPEPSGSEISNEETPYLSPIKTENATSQSRLLKNSMSRSKISPPSKGSIYGTVYRQLRKAINSKSVSSGVSLDKSKKSATTFNYGDYLYAKGLKSKEQNEKFKEMKKQEQFEKEIHNFTFSPLINTNSSLISPRVYDKPENILMKKKQENDEKLRLKKEELEKEYFKECVFSPSINEVSKNRLSVGNIHSELYLQAEKQKERRVNKIEEELKQIPFKPDVKTARKKNVFETKEQLFDRLDTSKKTTEEEIQKLREEKLRLEQEEIENTSRKMRNSLSDANMQRHNSESIWEYLYSQRDSKKKELFTSQQEFMKQVEAASISKKTTDNSERIATEFRKNQYEKLFRAMDSDYDGDISATAININSMDVAILKVLTPFFEELEKTKKSLNLEKFSRKMEELYRSLNVEQRAILIKRNEKKEEEQLERKPFISAKSSIIAEEKKKSLPADFLERQSTLTKMTEMKMQKIRDEKEDMSLKECTFKPLIKTN